MFKASLERIFLHVMKLNLIDSLQCLPQSFELTRLFATLFSRSLLKDSVLIPYPYFSYS